MRLSAWCGLGMVAALLGAACGSGSNSESSARGGSGSSGEAGADGASAGASGATAAGGATATAGTGGTAGVGSGELDETCRERTTNHVAGDEIGLRERVTAEGDRAFVGFYDKARGTDCEFFRDAEGTLRCFPPVRSIDKSWFYLDADCSQEVAYRGICGREHFAVAVSDDSCEERSRVFALGASIQDAMVWERNADGECVQYAKLSQLHEVGEELVPAEYPAVSETTWRGLGRIARRGFEGPGGLRVTRQFRDTQLDEACSVNTLWDGKRYCAPFRLGNFELTDETCSKTLLSSRSVCGAPAAKYGAAGTTKSCLGQAYVERDQPFDGALHVRGASCSAATGDQDLEVFTVKAVPPEHFVELEPLVDETDPGRLKPVYNTSADGACWFEGWHDSEQDTTCEFLRATDNWYRCMPPPRSVTKAFSDATCTTPSEAYYVACKDAPAPQLVTLTVQQDCGGDNRVEVRPVVASLASSELPPIWVGSSESCVAWSLDTGSTYHQLGDPLPPETFMAAELEP